MRALRAISSASGGRRRDGDEGADADGRGLLHQLEAAAAGHDDEARGEIGAGLGQRADQLVERVVAADILAHEHDVAGER